MITCDLVYDILHYAIFPIQLLEAQERYHYESLKIIQKILPNVQTQVGEL